MSSAARIFSPMLLASTLCVVSAITSAEDRGIPLSLFGSFIKENEHILYLFYEYGHDADSEYTPGELGFTGDPVIQDTDYRGERTYHEALMFYSYAFTDRLAFEIEAAVYQYQELIRDPNDTNNIPGVGRSLEESGFGSVQSELRYFLGKGREYYAYTEVEFPFQKDKKLIGAQDWEFVQGFGKISELASGTLLARISIKYDRAETEVGLGEYALEYIKDLQSGTRLYGGIEGEDDEISFIGEVQFHIATNAVLKLNTGIGLTSKAEDIAPEIGVLWTF